MICICIQRSESGLKNKLRLHFVYYVITFCLLCGPHVVGQHDVSYSPCITGSGDFLPLLSTVSLVLTSICLLLSAVPHCLITSQIRELTVSDSSIFDSISVVGHVFNMVSSNSTISFNLS